MRWIIKLWWTLSILMRILMNFVKIGRELAPYLKTLMVSMLKFNGEKPAA